MIRVIITLDTYTEVLFIWLYASLFSRLLYCEMDQAARSHVCGYDNGTFMLYQMITWGRCVRVIIVV